MARDDANAAALLERWRSDGRVDPMEIGLLGGDLHRTLGSPRHNEADLFAGRGVRYPCDAIHVEAWGPRGRSEHLAVAHLVARTGRRLFADRTVVVMNAAFRGEANLGPRAHPGDGLLDLTDGAVARREVRKAMQRAVSGSHVPHPGLRQERAATFELAAGTDRPWHLELDGVAVGRAERLMVRCLPGAMLVVA